MAKTTRRHETLAEGVEEITTRRRRHIPPGSTDAALPLELWLAQMAALPQVTRIIANKREAGGKYSRLAEGTLEPPFDLDQNKFFKKYGDGDYKFSVLAQDFASSRQEWHTHRFETVSGYGAVNQPAAAAAAADPMAELAKIIEVKRLGLISRYMDRDMEALEARASAAAAGGNGAEDFDVQLDRFAKIAVLMHKGGGASKLEDTFATWIPRLFEKLAGGDPADRQLDGMEKMLAFADRLNGFRGGGEALDMNTMLLMALLGAMGNPQVHTMIQQLLARVVPGSTVRHPAGATTTAQPTPAAEPAAVPAAAATAEAPAADAAAVAVLRGLIWPMVRRAIELQTENFESYADVIDAHLEGFLDHWAAMELEAALAYVAPLEPELVATPAARAWLSRFHAYLVENPPDEPAGGAPTAPAAPAAPS